MKTKDNTLPEKLTIDNVTNFIDSYPTKHKHGFTSDEIESILVKYNIDKSKFHMGINTCMIIDGDTINYSSDFERALKRSLR